MSKIKVGDKVIARWTHGKGKRGEVVAVREWTEEHRYYTETHVFIDVKLDGSGLIEERPAMMVELVEEITDNTWIE